MLRDVLGLDSPENSEISAFGAPTKGGMKILYPVYWRAAPHETS
jgi:hypothetical protein